MLPPGSHLIEDLTTSQRGKLAQLLCLPPHLDPTDSRWLSNQSTLLENLPSPLLKPQALLLRLAMRLDNSIQKATLCPIHSALNPFLIRRIFIQVTAECTIRLGRLLSSPCPLPLHIHHLTVRLQSLNSLWMSPEAYSVTFGAMPREPSFKRVGSDCEACILARIGGNTQILSDLRTNMLGRRKKRGPKPRLLGLVEAWIGGCGKKEEERLFWESENLGREVRGERRNMQIQRRRIRGEVFNKKEEERRVMERSAGSTRVRQSDDTGTIRVALDNEEASLLVSSMGNEMDGDNEHDIEGSIINYYNRRISIAGSHSLRNTDRASNFHSAFRDSVIFDAPSGTFARRPETPRNIFTDPYEEDFVPQPLRPNARAATAYTESIYSTSYDSGNTASRQNSSGFLSSIRRNAEEQARAYQNLVDIDEEDEQSSRATALNERGSRGEEQRRSSEDVPIRRGSTRAQEQHWDIPTRRASTRNSSSTHWTDFY